MAASASAAIRIYRRPTERPASTGTVIQLLPAAHFRRNPLQCTDKVPTNRIALSMRENALQILLHDGSRINLRLGPLLFCGVACAMAACGPVPPPDCHVCGIIAISPSSGKVSTMQTVVIAMSLKSWHLRSESILRKYLYAVGLRAREAALMGFRHSNCIG